MNNANRFKAGLGFGIVMTVFSVLQNLLTSENQTSNEIVTSIGVALTTGAISGVLFGWLIGLFAKSRFVTQTTKIETEKDEYVLFETPANHFKGIEGVGGKLYLTDRRLVFKSHKLNVQSHQLSINLTDIRHVDRYKTLGVVNNGLSVTIANNTTEKFVVEKVAEWIGHLT